VLPVLQSKAGLLDYVASSVDVAMGGLGIAVSENLADQGELHGLS